MTVAPEVDRITGDGGVIDALDTVGALPSFGHTDASWTQTRTAFADGRARLDVTPGHRSPRPTVTHLFNGMRPLPHRDPGSIPELLEAGGREDLVVELIGDGTHVAPELVRSVFELVGAANVVLVPDAMTGTGTSQTPIPLSHAGVEAGYKVRYFTAAYERRSLAIASHWSFEDWGRFLPEEATKPSPEQPQGVGTCTWRPAETSTWPLTRPVALSFPYRFEDHENSPQKRKGTNAEAVPEPDSLGDLPTISIV